MSPGNTHVGALTSLRFLAAFAVLMFHSGGPSLIATGHLPAFVCNLFLNGYLGVTFFFVLSGFILATVYRGKLDTSAAMRRYGLARFARVYPVYLLALVLMIPFMPFEGWGLVWQQFVLLQSWTTFTPSGGPANWNMQSWTLSVELLFYLLFPLLVNGLDRVSSVRLAWLLLPVCTLIVGLRLPGVTTVDDLLFSWMNLVPLPLLRLPEFVFGVLLGLLHARGAVPAAPRFLPIAMILVIPLLAVSSSRWIAPAATLLFGAIIVLTPASLGVGPLGKILSHPAMVRLGAASYALYLLASPVHFINEAVWRTTSPLMGRLVYVPLLLGLSLAVFRWFEEPARELLRGRIRLRPQTAPAVG